MNDIHTHTLGMSICSSQLIIYEFAAKAIGDFLIITNLGRWSFSQGSQLKSIENICRFHGMGKLAML